MTQALPLRRYAERCLDGDTTDLRVDLRACLHADSTFLGTLLNLQRTTEKRGRGKVTLLSPSSAFTKVLAQMGLNTVFCTEECPPPEGPWSDLPAEPADPGSFKRNVAEAHQELANVPGACGEQFRPVAECLTRAADAPPPPPPAPEKDGKGP